MRLEDLRVRPEEPLARESPAISNPSVDGVGQAVKEFCPTDFDVQTLSRLQDSTSERSMVTCKKKYATGRNKKAYAFQEHPIEY